VISYTAVRKALVIQMNDAEVDEFPRLPHEQITQMILANESQYLKVLLRAPGRITRLSLFLGCGTQFGEQPF